MDHFPDSRRTKYLGFEDILLDSLDNFEEFAVNGKYLIEAADQHLHNEHGLGGIDLVTGDDEVGEVFQDLNEG